MPVFVLHSDQCPCCGRGGNITANDLQAVFASHSELADKLNINTADAATIAAEMNGLGECRAKEIVRYREQVGKFKSIDELENVSGIGYKTVEKNRDSIHL